MQFGQITFPDLLEGILNFFSHFLHLIIIDVLLGSTGSLKVILDLTLFLFMFRDGLKTFSVWGMFVSKFKFEDLL